MKNWCAGAVPIQSASSRPGCINKCRAARSIPVGCARTARSSAGFLVGVRFFAFLRHRRDCSMAYAVDASHNHAAQGRGPRHGLHEAAGRKIRAGTGGQRLLLRPAAVGPRRVLGQRPEGPVDAARRRPVPANRDVERRRPRVRADASFAASFPSICDPQPRAPSTRICVDGTPSTRFTSSQRRRRDAGSGPAT